MGSGTSRISQSIEKKNGDEAYKLGNYQEAILWYSISLSMNEENTQNQKNIRCTLLSNRSSAYYMNGQYHLALLDAQNVIELNSNWSKGYFRAAKACEALHRLHDAFQYYQQAAALSDEDETINEAISRLKPEIKMSQGSLLTWGLGESCGLGHSDLRDKHHPTVVEGIRGKHIVDISCGAMHTVVVTGTGEVYSWGQNKYGQVGIISKSNENLKFIVPRLVTSLLGISILAVSCGAGHTIVMSTDGRVFSWGMGGYGQLGHGNLENLSTPSQIVSLQSYSILAISCGIAHSIFLIGDGESSVGKRLMGCGMNTYGALGFETSDHAISLPSSIPLPPQLSGYITFVSCGGAHTAVVDERGRLYLSGSNTCGQLGLNTQTDFIPTLTMVSLVLSHKKEKVTLPEFVYVACGEEFSIAITRTHQVYATGLGIAGQMGNGSQENNFVFTHIETLDNRYIEEVCCSQGVIFGVSRNGEVWSWGQPGNEFVVQNSSYEPTKSNELMIPQLYSPLSNKKRRIRMIRCGRRHYAALTVAAYGPTSYLKHCNNSTIKVEIGKKLKLTLQCCDIMGNELSFSGCIVIGHLVKLQQHTESEEGEEDQQVSTSNDDLSLYLDDNFDGSFSIETINKIILSGEYQLSLTIDDLHIFGSPFRVLVNYGAIVSLRCHLRTEQQQPLDSSNLKCLPNQIVKFSIEFLDQYQNKVMTNGIQEDIELRIRIVNDMGTIISENREIIRNQILKQDQEEEFEFLIPSQSGSYRILITARIEDNDIEDTIPCDVQFSPLDSHFEVLFPTTPSVEEEILITLQWDTSTLHDIDIHKILFDSKSTTTGRISSTITPLHSSLSARALIQLYTWNQDPCQPIKGILLINNSIPSNSIIFSHHVRVSGKALVTIFIDNQMVYSSEIYIYSGKISPIFSELLQPHVILHKWNINETERILKFLLRDCYGNPCDRYQEETTGTGTGTGTNNLLFFAEEWKGNDTNNLQILIPLLLSPNQLEIKVYVLDSDRDSEYWINVGIITTTSSSSSTSKSPRSITKERQKFQYSPFCLGAKDVDIPLLETQITDSQILKNLEKIEKLERTKRRAKEALKAQQRLIFEEKERNRIKKAARRTGGGFIVQYSQEI